MFEILNLYFGIHILGFECLELYLDNGILALHNIQYPSPYSPVCQLIWIWMRILGDGDSDVCTMFHSRLLRCLELWSEFVDKVCRGLKTPVAGWHCHPEDLGPSGRFWATRLWPAFGRQSLVGSSGGYTSHGYTSHASPRACGARLGQIVKSV